MADSPSADDVTLNHVTGTENSDLSPDIENMDGLSSILKHSGEAHSNPNSVKFKTNNPTGSFPSPKLTSDPNDVTVSIAMEIKRKNGQRSNGDHQLAEVVTHTDDRRGSESRIDMEEPRYYIAKSDLDETLVRVRQHFLQYVDQNNRITEEAFKEALGKKAKSFFADRFFWFLDTNHNGFIDMSELSAGARVLLSGTTTEKVNFVFTLFDMKNLGNIPRDEMREVLTACVKECKMKLQREEIDILTDALYDAGDSDKDGVITREDMTRMLKKYPHALDSLTYNASIWLQPASKHESEKPCARYFSTRYLANNAKRIAFVLGFWLINAGLFFLNAYLYRNEIEWVIFARGCAMIVNFTSLLVVLLPLRNWVTYLRTTIFYRIFPMDHTVSLHKMVGMTLFVFSLLHSVGQVGNAVYISDNSNLTVVEVVFTRKADIGWVLGLAPVTGVVLVAILLTMVIAARPIVRRRGHFQIFYWTHKLYFLYFLVCIIHAKHFWKWMIFPAVIFWVDKIVTYIRRSGGTKITSFYLLPSEVTQLNILKPPGFTYRPGDYVHIKVPAIAKYEYHPFTISSAPEKGDHFSVHIRSAGNWTRGLREYLLTHFVEPHDSKSMRKIVRGRHSSMWDGARTSLARKKIASIRGRTLRKDIDLTVFVDGPYGSPCRNIFEAEHAILIGSGIGATPFSSILQSIMYRFKAGEVTCPNCNMTWCPAPRGLAALRKVDFVWINRDQNNFEWFTALLTKIEREMANEAALQNAITMHMFMTGAPSQYDIHGVGVQMALDLVREAKSTDLITGLTTRTQGGRPDFDKLLSDIKNKSPCSKLKVFFCGNPALAKTIKGSCVKLDIAFSKEQF
ncbi:hypothetical protein RRG08_014329 [Elysia crispata]|uniref:NADPH oxidase n=1 Tax=Elysia crispata TaxID=231223 RepID=A0AAE0Z0T0_9GAST|nr:hypothetical protein RRG08_014329 [Elysia crispata]